MGCLLIQCMSPCQDSGQVYETAAWSVFEAWLRQFNEQATLGCQHLDIFLVIRGLIGSIAIELCH